MVLESTGSSSKSSNIRSLLIRAWRERWSDMQWGIHIKTVLPRYISGDIYHLSDCILQQALMGPLPNQLILSYLRHSLASQVVSYGGVIESISKYESLQKVYCVRSLLDLLSRMVGKLTCRGKPEDCLALATALVVGVRWLLRVTLFAAGRANSEQTVNLKSCVRLLREYFDCSFLKGLLRVARLEDEALWSQLLSIVSEIESKMTSTSTLAEFKDVLPKIFADIRSTKPLQDAESKATYNPASTPICHGVHARVLVEAVMHSTQSSQSLANQLILYKQLKGMSEKDLYLELLVSSFLGLGSEEQFPHQNLHWVGFTFIKVPSIIQHLHSSLHGTASSQSPSEALLAAVQQLGQRSTLLDIADHRMNCNCLEYLLHELILCTSLLIEQDATAIITRRQEDPNAVCVGVSATKETLVGHMAIPNLILRAQPTVSSILKTLSNKNQESVLPVMNLLISGKSRDLLLTAAAASGKLFIYAQKFVKFNQQSLQPQPGETELMAKNRALMFDTTFLLLCHIAQVYGIDVVIGENSETFVESWMRCHMPEQGRVKMITPHIRSDSSRLVEVMQQVNAQDLLAKYCQTYWATVCQASPQIMQKLTSEFIQGSVTLQTATELLDRVCGHACSLPICFTAWTCSYLQEVSGVEASKVNALLSHLQKKLAGQEPALTLGSFKDRSMLMSEIIDNMVKVTKETNLMKTKNEILSQKYNFYNSLIVKSNLKEIEIQSCSLTDSDINDVLGETWKQVFEKSGLLTHAGLWAFQRLLRLGGHNWFVFGLVDWGLKNVFEADLTRAMDIIYGVMQMDIEQCCISLLVHCLPHYLDYPGSSVLHSYRRIGALARLTVQVLVSAWAAAMPSGTQLSTPSASSNMDGVAVNPARKRSFSLISGEDEEELLKQVSILTVDVSAIQGLSSSGISIMVSLQKLLTKLCHVVPRGVVSPVSELVVAILQELVVAPPILAPLLTLLPANLLPILLALHPPLTFSPGQLLCLALPTFSPELPSPLSHIQEAAARRAAAKLLCTHRNFGLASASVVTGDHEPMVC